MAHAKEEKSKDLTEEARNEKISELNILKESLDEKKKLADDYLDQLLRLKADFENYRKRTERDKHNHMMWGKESVLLKQINILDILEQAYKSTQASTNIEAVRKGLELIIQEFIKMISSEDIEEIKALGEKFDPAVHEAVDYVESDEDEGSIVNVLQKGYTLKGKLLRPAKVMVAKKEKKKGGTREEISNTRNYNGFFACLRRLLRG